MRAQARPAADRNLGLVFAEHRLPPQPKAWAHRAPVGKRAIQERNFSRQQRAVSVFENALAAIRPVQWNAVEHRGADDYAFDGLSGDPQAHRGIGENRRPFDTALREFRADPERAVQEQSGRLEAIELAVEVIEAGE